jgi:hypothetical protein
VTASQSAADIYMLQREDMLAVAAAAQKVSEENSLLTDGVIDAKAAHQAYIDKLTAEAATLAPGSQLQVYLDAYITKLKNDIPPVIHTQLQLDTAAATAALVRFRQDEIGPAAHMPARASGGPVTAGVPYLVNENTAHSEIFVPRQSGTITPNAPSAGVGAGGQTNHITQNITGSSDPAATAALVNRRLAEIMS